MGRRSNPIQWLSNADAVESIMRLRSVTGKRDA